VKARHVQEWTVTLLGRYSDAYANNQFRALQQFFRWHATEDRDEPRPLVVQPAPFYWNSAQFLKAAGISDQRRTSS
jgi:hypothetical protein